MLYGRDVELLALDSVLDGARSSRSGVLVMRGEPGVGKSALLEEAVKRASGMQVLRAAGIETESELAFAALHQLLLPLLERVDEIPAPQAAALRGALGLGPGAQPDRFLISVAVLSLLAAEAERQPLLCAVDDAQWLDQPSAEALAFAARRLEAEALALIFAAREGEGRGFEAPGLPQLQVAGLGPEAADALLAQRTGVSPPAEVRERLLASTGGNPLALLELPELLSKDQLAGRAPLAEPVPVGRALEAAFLERARRLSPESQELLLIAAADDTGDPAVVLRAARQRRIEGAAFRAVEAAGLVRFGDPSVEFRHPLIRSAVYQGASLPERQEVHELLAELLEGEEYADRRAWHRAAATTEPDAEIAEALERTADKARRRSGYAAAALAFERAATLTPADEMRARRLLAAADADWLAGRPHQAAALLERARPLASHPLLLADIDHLRGTIEFGRGEPAAAHAILIEGANAVTPLDTRKALQMLLSAGEAAGFSGDFSKEIKIARRAEGLSEEGGGDDFESLWLVGVGSILAEDLAKGMQLLRPVVAAADALEDPRRLTSAGEAAVYLGDPPAAIECWERAARTARRSGAIGSLPLTLALLAAIEVIDGRLSSAAANASEGLDLSRDTGQENNASYHLAILARVEALRGQEQQCQAHAEEALELASVHGLHFQAATAAWALGQLELGLGRSTTALARFEPLATVAPTAAHPIMALYTTPDLVEAATRAGRSELAEPGLKRFAEWADATGSPWPLALAARCRAQVSSGQASKRHFEEARRLHAAGGQSFEGARTELAYGEFLRRAGERKQARDPLRSALELFDQAGATPWAERARAELRASGESARRRDPSTIDELTPQELQIARFVAEGATNRQVAEQLFLSPRTIDYHLRNIFRKLGITSRSQLGRFLTDHGAKPTVTGAPTAPVGA